MVLRCKDGHVGREDAIPKTLCRRRSACTNRCWNENIAVDSPEARGPLGKPDNWLVGRLWLNHGYELVDSGVKIRRQTPLNFYETGPKWRIKHAEAIEKEGILDESAQNAWQMAAEDWAAFGNRSIPTTSPFTIKLDQLDELKRQKAERMEEFRELTQELYDAEQSEVDRYDADENQGNPQHAGI